MQDSRLPAIAGSTRRRGLSLEYKLPLLISALLAVVVAACCWAAYREVRRSAIGSATERLQRATKQLAELSRDGMDRTARQESAVASDSLIRRAMRSDAKPEIATAALQRLILPNDSTLTTTELWTADGNRRLTLGTPSSAVDTPIVHALLRDIARTDSARQGALLQIGDSIFVWSMVPVRERRVVIGGLAQRHRIGNNPNIDAQMRALTGQEVSSFVVNADGGLWSDLRGRPVDAPYDVRALGDTFVVTQRNGASVIGAQAPVMGTPWLLVLSVPSRSVLVRPRAFLDRMILFGLLVLIGSAAGAWMLSRRVTNPLRELTEAAEALAGGDFGQRVMVERSDELGRLATTFNAMALRIGDSRQELERRFDSSVAMANALERLNADLRTAQDQTLRAIGRTEQLQRVTAALAAALDFDEVARVIVEQGVAAVNAAAGALLLVSPEGTALDLVRTVGYPAETKASWKNISMSDRLPLTDALRAGEPLFIGSTTDLDAGYSPNAIMAMTSPASVGHSWAALPLRARGRTLGALALSFANAQPFDREMRAFLIAFAQLSAQSLDRALLFDAAVHARQEAEGARQTAEAANQAKAVFLATMSHELRTPLNAIAGYAELLEMGVRGAVTDEQRVDLQRIRRSQQHLLTLINDVLHFAKLEAGHIEFQLGSVSLEEALGDIEPLITPQLRAKRLALAVHPFDPELRAMVDSEKLRQILLNLLSNAIKFTDPDGRIDVECGPCSGASSANTPMHTHAGALSETGFVYVRVRDTGVGIPPDRLATVFEPFVQAEQRLTRVHDGIGLGLTISRDLARGMGGDLSVESVVGKGSAFTLTLPAAHAPAQLGAPAPLSSAEA